MRPGFIDPEVVLQVAVFRLPKSHVEANVVKSPACQPYPCRGPMEDFTRVGEPELLPFLNGGSRPCLREKLLFRRGGVGMASQDTLELVEAVGVLLPNQQEGI